MPKPVRTTPPANDRPRYLTDEYCTAMNDLEHVMAATRFLAQRHLSCLPEPMQRQARRWLSEMRLMHIALSRMSREEDRELPDDAMLRR